MVDQPEVQVAVVVVGGGASGLAAAVAAAEGGAQVVLLERREQLGGTTAWSVGSLTAAGTSLQRRKGITDSAAALAEDMWKFNEALLSGDAPDLRRLYAAESAATFEWLLDHGVAFSGPYPEPPHRVPRMHNVIPSSRAYIARLGEAAKRAAVQVVTSADVQRLLIDDGAVVGVLAEVGGTETAYRATSGVVLATGDFSGSTQLRTTHLSASAAAALPVNPDALGIGHQLAAEAGAELKRMDQLFGPQLRFAPPPRGGIINRLPLWRWLCRLEAAVVRTVPPRALRPVVKSLLVSHMSPTNAMFKAGAILVDSRGRRFGREADPAGELSAQPGCRGFLLLDERVAQHFNTAPNHISTAPGVAFAYFDDYRRGRPDLLHRGADAKALAEAISADPAELAQAVATSELSGPLLALGPVYSMLTVTEGSVAVDERLAALRPDGTPIPGLYAVGGVGQGGMLLQGHGHHIGWAMTSGRLVGQQLAAGQPADASTGSPR